MASTKRPASSAPSGDAHHLKRKRANAQREKQREKAEENGVAMKAAPPQVELSKEMLEKYSRGPANTTRGIKDRKLQSGLRRAETKARDAVRRAAEAEVLLPSDPGFLEAEGPMERTYRMPQRELRKHVDLNTARAAFELSLPRLGPYRIAFTRNGRHLILGGAKGHLAVVDALRYNVATEVQLKDPIKDVCALHNETLMAVAQRKYVYIYDSTGAEVHCLRGHLEPNRLQFLPYHFLLASVGRTGYLKYQDVSTGNLVAELRTKLGSCNVMRQSNYNAVVHLGHANGVVTLWTPALGTPLARMLCHRGPVTALALDDSGRYMVTAGQDGRTKVWDIRTYKELQRYLTPRAPTVMDISQRGLLAIGFGCHVQVWRDALATRASAPYMEHHLANGASVHGAAFRPYEDSLGVGHSAGYSTMIVPGAGEPNFDTFEANPFQSPKQRREAEVQALLNKLQPETIALDPKFVGGVDKDPAELVKEQRALAQKADKRGVLAKRSEKEREAEGSDGEEGDAQSGKLPKERERNRKRGRSKIGAKLKRKQKNVVDAAVAKRRAALDDAKKREKDDREKGQRLKDAEGAPKALSRFFDA